MQMAAFFNTKKGLLVIGNDASGGISDWKVLPNDRLQIDFYETYPEVITIPINPDIASAASEYRTWARKQYWIKNRQRANQPMNFVSVASGSSLNVDQAVLDSISKLPIEALGVWMTLWRRYPFDTMYPDYVAKELVGFRRFLSNLKSREINSFPYINGLTWDANYRTFGKVAESVALRDISGNTVEYKSTMSHLRYACPHSPEWQSVIAGARNSLTDLNSNRSSGVYMDMLAATTPMICWSSEHGHSPGDPYAWVGGIRQLLALITGKIFIEGCAEVYLDLFDYPLMHFHSDKADSAPLWKMVYGDVAPGYGWQVPARSSLHDFKALHQTALQFGSVAHGSPWLSTEHEQEFLKRGFHDFVSRHKS